MTLRLKDMAELIKDSEKQPDAVPSVPTEGTMAVSKGVGAVAGSAQRTIEEVQAERGVGAAGFELLPGSIMA